jgi:uncharacterized membrane-anchored protein YjiN (DUF445 family)
MRGFALLLLALMTVIFVATSVTSLDWPWLPYVRAFAEAGMVGACADWFAVVALFRHPLGIPIPHTAIVPSNKNRIGAALGRFIENNFLNQRVAHEQLARVDFAGFLVRWIDNPNNSRQLIIALCRALLKASRSLRDSDLGEIVGLAARDRIEAIPAAPLASKVLAVVWAGGAAQGAVERGLQFCETSLVRYKPKIAQAISQDSSRWIPRWVDHMIADKVTAGLLSTLREMRHPNHPWRIELRAAVDGFIADLARDPKMFAIGEKIKRDILQDPVLAEQAKALWEEIDRGLDQTDTLAAALDEWLQAVGKWLSDDPDRQVRLNRQIRLGVLRVLLPRRAQISAYVTRVVQNWNETTIVDRLELQVGKDLQYIRINGTLVGGLVGLLIFTASKWIASH